MTTGRINQVAKNSGVFPFGVCDGRTDGWMDGRTGMEEMHKTQQPTPTNQPTTNHNTNTHTRTWGGLFDNTTPTSRSVSTLFLSFVVFFSNKKKKSCSPQNSPLLLLLPPNGKKKEQERTIKEKKRATGTVNPTCSLH